MSRTPWWSAPQAETRPRFWEFWRRQATAETPVRVEFQALSLRPAEVLRIALPLPTAVRSVPCCGPILQKASSVGLEPVPERVGQSPPHPVGDWPGAPGGPPDRPQGPALAERLRAPLAVPLESLLPGPSAILEWPGKSYRFSLTAFAHSLPANEFCRPTTWDSARLSRPFRTDEAGIEQKLYVQCKDHARPVGVDVIRELLGILPADRSVRPVLAAPMGVTSGAALEVSQGGVRIWDAAVLAALESGE